LPIKNSTATPLRETAAKAEAYSAYLARIHPQLPEDFQRLLASVCIHDAALRELTVDLAGGWVTWFGDPKLNPDLGW
jgi:hypothetical protein